MPANDSTDATSITVTDNTAGFAPNPGIYVQGTNPPPQSPPPAPTPAPDEEPDPNELGEKGVKALEAMKVRAREAERKAKRVDELEQKLQAFEDRDKSEADKLAERAVKAEQAAKDAERRYLIAQVALDKGLPPKLAMRLQGETEQELLADADELLATLQPRTMPQFNGGVRTPTPSPDEDMNARIRRQAGRA